MMKIKDFKFDDWINQFSGNWSILTCSYWGNLYSRRPFTKEVAKCINPNIIILKKSTCWGYWRESERKSFAGKVRQLFISDKTYIAWLCHRAESRADNFLSLVKKYYNSDIGLKQYLQFQQAITDYYPYHIIIKVVADYLTEELLKKYAARLESARLYAEPVFSQSEKFMVALATIHGKKTGYKPELILACVRDEFHRYFQTGHLPLKKVLNQRYQASALLFHDQEMKIITGAKVAQIEALVNPVKASQNDNRHSGLPG